MGQTTNYNIPYPEIDNPRNIPEDMKNLADATDTAIKDVETNLNNIIDEKAPIEELLYAEGSFKLPNGLLIQWGRVTDITVPSSSYIALPVTFKKEFKTMPIVFAMPMGNYNIACQVAGNELSKTTINVRSNDSTQRTGRTIAWFAIGS